MQELNVIIMNEFVEENDAEIVFDDAEVLLIRKDNPRIKDVLDLLVIMECFPSKSQARKNWKGPIEWPDGFSEFTIGKLKRTLCIWNPTAKTVNYEE